METYPRFKAIAEFGPDACSRYRYVLGSNDIFNPHCHEYYEIFITVSGTVTHWINGVTKKLAEGSLVFIRPNDIHGYIYEDPKSSKSIYINLSFSEQLLHSLFTYLSDSFPADDLLHAPMPPTVLLNKTEKNRVVRQISELNTVDHTDKQALDLRMRVILAEIFAGLFADQPNIRQNDIPIWLSQVMREMQEPENFIAGSSRMICLSGKSREHLSRSMKKYCGMSLSQFINDLRINYASNLLINTNRSVIDICFASGYQSLSHFYKVFSDVYCVSPTEFRRQYQ